MSKRKIGIFVLVIVLVLAATVAAIVGVEFLTNGKTTISQKKEQTSAVQDIKKEKTDDKTDKDYSDGKEQISEEKEIESVQIWTTDTVKLRAKASTDGDVIEVLSKNTELTAVAETEEWYKVRENDKEGYVSKEYVTTQQPQEATATQEAGSQSANVVIGPSPATGGHIICIDPGHQASGDSNPEPNGPGSATTKARVTGGTTGTTTGVPEYQLNLSIALQLQQELQARGYTVYMTRSSHDVNISNKERAEFATSVGAEITVRIHANGSTNAGISGALALAPSGANPYVSSLAAASQSLSSCVLNAYCAATGLANQGVQANDTMTGINWCTMPVTILEMGYMTNPSDDTNMQDPGFQQKMVWGIANGIDTYFGH